MCTNCTFYSEWLDSVTRCVGRPLQCTDWRSGRLWWRNQSSLDNKSSQVDHAWTGFDVICPVSNAEHGEEDGEHEAWISVDGVRTTHVRVRTGRRRRRRRCHGRLWLDDMLVSVRLHRHLLMLLLMLITMVVVVWMWFARWWDVPATELLPGRRTHWHHHSVTQQAHFRHRHISFRLTPPQPVTPFLQA